MNNGEAPDAQTMLDAWRERGADRLDPVRFYFIEALARRAGGHDGAARHILDQRLAQLLKTYGEDLENRAGTAGEAVDTTLPREPARGPLARLLDDIAGHGPADNGNPPAHDAANRRAAYPELDALDYFKEIWSRVSTDRQLRQSLEQVHENAGPLNSSRLVHRTLQLMRELSPGYLRQFLSYADALSWMEQLNGAGAAAGKDAPRATAARKSSRAR